MDTEYISPADTAKIVRKALAASFPGVKFSVRTKTYAGGASIDVEWYDGPTRPTVEHVVKQFEGADFDGMVDLKTYHDTMLDGKRVHFRADYVFCTRRYTLEGYSQLVTATCKFWGIETVPAIAITSYGSPELAEGDFYVTQANEFFYTLAYRVSNNLDMMYTPPSVKKSAQPAPVVEAYTGQDCTITHDRNWTWLSFPSDPGDAVRRQIRELGANWSTKRHMWYFTHHVSRATLLAIVNPGDATTGDCDIYTAMAAGERGF